MVPAARVGRRLTSVIRRCGAAAAAVLAVMFLATGFRAAPPPAQAGATAPAPTGARPVQGVKTVPFKAAKATVPVQTGRTFTASATRWPPAASGMIHLAAPQALVPPEVAPAGASPAVLWQKPAAPAAGATAAAAGTPAWAQAVAPANGRYSGPSSVAVDVESQSLASRLGVHGVVWQLSGLTPGAGAVRAGLDYQDFAQAYGGNYGLRLTLEELPACALTTPQVPSCRRGKPLPTVNDASASTVSALLPLPATPASGATATSGAAAAAAEAAEPAGTAVQPTAVVLAATTTAGGEGGAAGTYGATTLKPAGSWAEGGSTGSFTYSYPVSVPSASSPLTPSVSLDYDSGSVDGQTAATQAQAGWAGDGWSTGDSYVEQSFVPCADSPEGVTLPSAEQTQDMCYDGNVVTMSLDGRTTSLVRDGSTGTWRLQDDDGAVVTKVTGSGNGSGTNDTSYWKVTERDGNAYYFGLNHLPGWASGDTATDSVDSEPVYSASSGDPCYSSSGFSSSVCTMAYRWHLDYVTDVHGDAMAYYYGQDTNYYGQDNGAHDVSYVRDSHLKEIDYGFRAGQAYTAGAVPDKVVFGTSSRCVASSCPAISSSNSGTAGSDYPDVPYDLNCASGSSCTTYGPTFWSTVRLTSITTEQYSVSSSAYQDVDSYALAQTEPATGDGTSPTLWLSSVTRTGDDTSAGGSSSAQALPPVRFGGIDLANRVDTANFPGLYRYRIDQVTTEMGAVTQVTYGTPDACSASYVDGMTTSAEAASNTRSCYPVWWTPDGYTAPVMDWFEKYAVTEVTTSDTTGGALTGQTSYSYGGGAAWHYDDNEVVKAKYRTYGQFRGYGSVTTLDGDGVNDPQTKQVTAYYRGMSDDNNSTAVTVTDSQGGTHNDAGQLAGQPLETTVYNGNGGPVDHSTIYSYWVSGATATRSRSGLRALTANMVQTAETWNRQALTDGGTTTWRYTETDTTYDAGTSDADFGLATRAYTHTVPASSAYDQCTSTTYAPASTSENLIGLVASAETDSTACSGFTEGSPASVPSALNTLGAPSSVSRPAQVMSATENFYDDPGFSTAFPQTTAPTAGNVTMTRKASGYSSGFTWQTTARDTYDAYGRVQDAYDGNGNETVTARTVNSAGLTTGQTVTNPLGQATAQTLDPTRGLTLTSTDANGVVTTEQYDTLGRLTSVWLDSRATTAEANYTYAYTVSATSATGTVAKTMGDAGGYATTVTILDSLGRTRQTQSDTPQGGRLVTDDFYDSRGWEWKKNNRWWDSNNLPALSLVTPTTANGELGEDSQVPDQDVYTFNGLGDKVQDASREYGNTISTTTTVYNGDRTTVIPPTGGVTKATVTDPLGRTSETDEYTAAPALHTPADTFTGIWYLTGGTTTATAYGYDGHGNQAVITDAGGHTWTTTYNLLGQATAKADPDAGTTAGMTYDGDGNLLQQTSADGKTVSFTYDQLSRKTAEYAAASGSQSPSNETASWAYDNSNNAVPGMKDAIGQLTTETSYSGGLAYTIQQAGFNVFGEPLGERVTIPATAATTGLSGSYSFGHTYTTGTGLPFDDKYPAAGGLPAETTGHTYLGSPLPLPSGLGGTIDGYAQSTTYDAYGDVTQEEIGTGANLAYITSTYDPHTLKLTSQHVSRTVTPADVDEEDYTYDPDGNPTSQASTRLGSAAQSETQCYQYNLLDQLTAAWTATDNCAATPAPSSHSTVGDGLGTASAYWTTWSYDVLGDMTSSDQHSLSGGSDTVTTDTFGGTAGGPHALTTAAASGGTASTSTFGYDASGNMTSRATPATGSQALTWTADGKLATVTGSNGTAGYVYDADGSLLLQENPGSTTLYLPGEQLTAVTSGGTTTVTGARIIPLPSGGDVVRTGATTSYSFEIPDRHGTNDLSLDSTAQVPAWRQFTPYGAPRGPAAAWIDNRAFLNKPADPATGLDYIGARAYDPVTGQFISPDPVLDPADPADLDPYAYAEDNPVTLSDPSGKDPIAEAITGYLENHPSRSNNTILKAITTSPPSRTAPGNSLTAGSPGPARNASSGGTYNSYECGRFGLSCSNFDPKKAVPKSSGFNPFSWVVGQVRHHWRGIVQAAVFASCLSMILAVCLTAEGAGILADYAGNAVQYGAFSRNALLPAAKSIAIDVVSLPFGYAVQKVLDEGVILTSGLRAADTEDIRRVVGRLIGSYAPYIPRHSSDFVGYNQAVQFFAHPVPVLVQVGGRAAVNGASCNGGDVTAYCGG